MANEKNLIPLSERTKSEQREIASKGGKKSGESRRRKKNNKQLMEMLLSLPATSYDDMTILANLGIDTSSLDEEQLEEINQKLIIFASLILKAKAKTDLDAIQMILDITGQNTYKNKKVALAKEELKLKEKQIENNNW